LLLNYVRTSNVALGIGVGDEWSKRLLGRLIESGVIRVGSVLLGIIERVDSALNRRSAAWELMIHY
jgi:hypothetical protein